MESVLCLGTLTLFKIACFLKSNSKLHFILLNLSSSSRHQHKKLEKKNPNNNFAVEQLQLFLSYLPVSTSIYLVTTPSVYSEPYRPIFNIFLAEHLGYDFLGNLSLLEIWFMTSRTSVRPYKLSSGGWEEEEPLGMGVFGTKTETEKKSS